MAAESEAPSTSGAEGSAPPGSQGKPKKQYKQLAMPSPEQMVQEDVMNNCGVRTVLAAVMGAGLGAVFGIFMGTMDTAAIGEGVGPPPENQTTRQVFRQMVTSTRMRMWSYMKGFTVVGALYSGSECLIEKTRAKHDIYNTVYAGCATGAILAHSGGPKAMCFGCAGFAAFSAAIEKFMDH